MCTLRGGDHFDLVGSLEAPITVLFVVVNILIW